MAIVIQNNLYQSYSDRGAFVQKGTWQTSDVDEDEIKVGEQLPHWAGYNKPVVKSYSPDELVLDYQGETYTLHPDDEIELDSSLFSQEYGVSCYILLCVKFLKLPNIHVYSRITAADAGCVSHDDYKGSIRLADVTPDKELTRCTIKDSWWQESICPRFKSLYLLEYDDNSARLKYGDKEIVVKRGESAFLEEVGLSYSTAYLSVKID